MTVFTRLDIAFSALDQRLAARSTPKFKGTAAVALPDRGPEHPPPGKTQLRLDAAHLALPSTQSSEAFQVGLLARPE